MPPSDDQLRRDIVEVGRRLYERGFVASNDGNISIRLDDQRILTTPRSVSKGFMTPEMMVVVDHDGKKIAGERDASTELLMHLEVYRHRPDVKAVVHAHPPLATGFAVAGIPLNRAVLAEVITTLGSIPIADYGTPSTRELPDAVRRYIKAHDGLLLANHGALTVGTRCSRPTTRWRPSSTSRRSASPRGCSAASACSRSRRCSASRACGACTASRRRPPSAPSAPGRPRGMRPARSWKPPMRRASGSSPSTRQPAAARRRPAPRAPATMWKFG
jgi:ribulose-5-phosphate 4-epimerase/fuculose-1-phosphate aldolase